MKPNLLKKRQGSSLNQNIGIEQVQGLLLITASNFGACCHTDTAEPSKSLIIKICYPSKSRFSTEATDYGSKHEKLVRDIVIEQLSNIHENISVRDWIILQ